MLGRGRRDAPGRGLGWDPARAMELLTALSLGELALSFSRVPLFPVFDLSYFIVSILYLKYEPGELGRAARRRKPWIMGRTVPETGSGEQTDYGIMGFSYTVRVVGRREGGQGEKSSEIVGLGEGKRMRAGRKERNVIVQSRGNRCWGGDKERRSGVLGREGRMNLGKRHMS